MNVSSRFDVAGFGVIVTGGASGIGRATVELLESQGVKVAVFDLNGETPVDVSDAASVGRAVEETRGRLGPIDILVNAAGIGTGAAATDHVPVDGLSKSAGFTSTLVLATNTSWFPPLCEGDAPLTK